MTQFEKDEKKKIFGLLSGSKIPCRQDVENGGATPFSQLSLQ